MIEFNVTSSGQHVRIPTGRSEAAYVRKLDEMLIRLTSNRPLDRRGIEVRTAFGALPGRQARRDWLDGLGNAPDAGFKIRTAVVLMLTEAGIDDWETLSAINRVDDAIARDFALKLSAERIRNEKIYVADPSFISYFMGVLGSEEELDHERETIGENGLVVEVLPAREWLAAKDFRYDG